MQKEKRLRNISMGTQDENKHGYSIFLLFLMQYIMAEIVPSLKKMDSRSFSRELP